MSGEDFRNRYQLLKKLTETRVSTYLARAPNGDRIMVHLLPGGDRATRDLLERLDRLPEPARSRIRASERAEDGPVIVTDYLEDFESFGQWVSRRAAPDSPPPPGGEGPGEFTRLFELPGEREEPSSGRDDRSDEGDEPPRPDPGEPPPDPGEPPPDPGTDRPLPDAGPVPEEESDVDEGPGEFTRLFEAPDAAATEDEAAAAEDEAASEGGDPDPGSKGTDGEPPGEFTRLFELPGDREEPSSGEPPPAPESDRPPPDAGSVSDEESGADEGPGEFTRLFEAPDAAEGEPTPEEETTPGADEPPPGPGPPPGPEPEDAPPAPDPRTPPPPERSEAPPPPREEPPAEAGGEEPDSSEGPGEFTRMFGSPETPDDDDVSRLGGGRGSGRAGGGGGLSGGGEGLDYLERLSPDAGPGASSGSDAPRRSDPPPRRDAEPGTGGASGSSGPSEYTRIIEGRRAPGAGSVDGAVPAPGPQGGGGSASSGSPSASSAGGGSGGAVDEEPARWPWILGLVGVFLAAVGLVLYLALSGGDGSDQEETGQDGEAAVTEGARAPAPPEGAAGRSVELASGTLRFASRAQSSPGRTTRSSSSGDGKSEGT